MGVKKEGERESQSTLGARRSCESKISDSQQESTYAGIKMLTSTQSGGAIHTCNHTRTVLVPKRV